MSPDELQAYVKRLVDEAPPLGPTQQARLRELLRPGAIAVRASKRPTATAARAA